MLEEAQTTYQDTLQRQLFNQENHSMFLKTTGYVCAITCLATCLVLLPACQRTPTGNAASIENANETSEAKTKRLNKFVEDVTKHLDSGKHNEVDQVDITAPAGENRINILAWNVESDGNDPQIIAEQLKGMKGYHLFALSEVRGQPSFDIYTEALNDKKAEMFTPYKNVRGNRNGR